MTRQRQPSDVSGVASAIRRNGLAMLLAAGLTVVVELGTYALSAAAMTPDGAAAVTVLVGLVWAVVAGPVFAAGGATVLDNFLRGGAIADAGMVVLIVIVASSDALGVTGAIGIYLLRCGVVLAECSLVSLSGRVAGRHVLAMAAVLIVLALAAGPFWANAIIVSAPAPWQGRIVSAVVAVNPVFATASCLADGAAIVWNERPFLYEHTVLGRDVPTRAVRWYVTACIYAALAGAILTARAAIVAKRKR